MPRKNTRTATSNKPWWVIGILLITVLAIAVFFQPNDRGRKPNRLAQIIDPFSKIVNDEPFDIDYPQTKDFLSTVSPGPSVASMSPQELNQYFADTVLKELDDAMNDTHEVPLVKEKLNWLVKQMQNGSIKADIAFGPPPGHEAALAASSYDKGLRYVTFIGSAVSAEQRCRRPEAFHDQVVFAAFHETMHPTAFLTSPNHTWKERVQDESNAWVATMPVIRAWYMTGRHPGSGCWKIYKYFHYVCHDNPGDPKWTALTEHLTGGKPD